jgi:hypothetical protein
VECSEASEYGLFQDSFNRLGFPGEFKCMIKDFACAAVDHRCKDTPPIVTTEDVPKIGRPPLVWVLSYRDVGLNTWPASCFAFRKSPTFELHDSVDFLTIHGEPFEEP